MLRQQLSSFLSGRKYLTDELVEPGEQLIVIASFDVYSPPQGGFEEQDAQFEKSGFIIHSDSRQSKLTELHCEAVAQLNEWATHQRLLVGKECVCADVMIVLAQCAPVGTYVVNWPDDPIP